MNGEYLAILEKAIFLVNNQISARFTVKEIIASLTKIFKVNSIAMIMKNPKTDAYEMGNRYNISHTFAKTNECRSFGQKICDLLAFEPMVIINKTKNKDYKNFKLEYNYSTGIGIRVMNRNKIMGFFALYFDENFEVGEIEKEFFIAIGNIIAIAIESEENETKLFELKRYDDITGLYTYKYFIQLLQKQLDSCRRYKRCSTLVFLDIDNYKKIVHTYGLNIAEQMLREFSRIILNSMRKMDFAARYGADEIVICLTETPIKQARIFLNRLQEKAFNHKFTDKQIRITYSAGATEACCEDDTQKIFERVFKAFYKARITGKGNLYIIKKN